ncbi:MAG TPA: hypothetical protein V6D18_18690 [Thermosynechococcaceae cyanobacterium]
MLPEAFILVEVEPTRKTSYVDAANLQQCLSWYFQGIFDDVIDWSRLWMRCEQWIPGNSLAGLLDSDTLRKCLFALPEQHRTAIAFAYEPDDLELSQTLAHWFVQTSDPALSFAEYQQQLLCDAMLMLAEVVLRVL